MTRNKAINLAIQALIKQKRVFAFNANLYRMGIHSFRTEKDKKTYDDLSEAIKILEGFIPSTGT